MVLLSIVPGFLTSACTNAALGWRTWCGCGTPAPGSACRAQRRWRND